MTPRDRPAGLPLALAVLLALALAAQIVLAALAPAAEFPPVARVARIGGGPLPADPPPVTIPASLAGGSLFAPIPGVSGSKTGAAPPDPLGGVVIAGVVQRGRTRLALVSAPGGALHYVAPGGLVAGWRLAALGPHSALLTRGSDHLDLAYGAHAVVAPPSSATDSSE